MFGRKKGRPDGQTAGRRVTAEIAALAAQPTSAEVAELRERVADLIAHTVRLEAVVLCTQQVLEVGRDYMEGMSADADDALDELDAALADIGEWEDARREQGETVE